MLRRIYILVNPGPNEEIVQHPHLNQKICAPKEWSLIDHLSNFNIYILNLLIMYEVISHLCIYI